MLKFSKANSKISKLAKVAALKPWLTNKRKIYSFDLLSGFSCPAAKECMSRAIVENGKRKIQDGPETKFRCFSASQEVLYTNVYNLRKGNFDAIRAMNSVDEIAENLTIAMPKNAGIVRIHVAGDFFNENYFRAWLKVASENPGTLFYAYTKQLKLWVENANEIPENFILTASYGGRYDDMISTHDLRYSIVIEENSDAIELGIEVDDDDSHAAIPELKYNSFGLIIHGVQPKGRKKLTV